MNSRRVILVTGVGGYWGAHVAVRLHNEPDFKVIGMDDRPPFLEIEGFDYVGVGLENPILYEFLRSEVVEVICHLTSRDIPLNDRANGSTNAAGTSNILEAANRAGVRQVIIRSSTEVFGAHPDNPALLTEDMPLRGSQSTLYGRDLLEVESLVKETRSKGSQPSIALLRFANIIGAEVTTPFTRFLSQPSPKILLGFDPVMQLIHERDVLEAIAFAVTNGIEGDFNIAASGVMPLSRMMRLLRKIPTPVFHILAYRAERLIRKGRLKFHDGPPVEWDYLRYPWIADTGKMAGKMGFTPSMSSEDALLEFAGREPRQSEEPSAGGEIPDVAYLQELMRIREKQRTEGSNAAGSN